MAGCGRCETGVNNLDSPRQGHGPGDILTTLLSVWEHRLA
jgi:hypothetical protein